MAQLQVTSLTGVHVFIQSLTGPPPGVSLFVGLFSLVTVCPNAAREHRYVARNRCG